MTWNKAAADFQDTDTSRDHPTTRPPTPDAAADPTSQASTSNTNAGDGAKSFKLTPDERLKLHNAIDARVHNIHVTDGLDRKHYMDECIDRIEAIINEGWQTCDCAEQTA